MPMGDEIEKGDFHASILDVKIIFKFRADTADR